MKLCKNVFLEDVRTCEDTGNIEVSICANVNRENTFLFFTFEPGLNCNTFKTVCKTLGLSQKRFRELLSL